MSITLTQTETRTQSFNQDSSNMNSSGRPPVAQNNRVFIQPQNYVLGHQKTSSTNHQRSMSSHQPIPNRSMGSPDKNGFDSNTAYHAVSSERHNSINRSSTNISLGNMGSPSMGSNIYKAHSMDRLFRGTIDSADIPDVRLVRDGRERSKREMQELNERLASHLEKSRYLSAQNRKLSDELQSLKSSWGKETEKIRQMYDAELKQLRRLIDEDEREKGQKDAKIVFLENSNKELREELLESSGQNENLSTRLDQIIRELADKESELNQIKRRFTAMEEEIKRDKATLNKSKSEILKYSTELENESAQRIAAQSSNQTLMEEIEFLKRIHQQEIKELKTLIDSHSDQSREFWRNELSQVIHELQEAYDERFDSVRAELESFYMTKVREIRMNSDNDHESAYIKEENSKLKSSIQELKNKVHDLQNQYNISQNELNDLKQSSDEEKRRSHEERDRLIRDLEKSQDQLERLLEEIKMISDTKLNLEMEIAAYRKLLEQEEMDHGIFNRPSPAARNSTRSEQNFSSSQYSYNEVNNSTHYSMRPEVAGRTQNDKSFKGNIAIEECSSDGRHIQIHNVGNKIESLSNWRIIRHIDNGSKVVRYTFGAISLNPNEAIRIWAKGQRPRDSNPGDLESPYVSWGTGSHIHTVLYNEQGEEKAVHIQKTAHGPR